MIESNRRALFLLVAVVLAWSPVAHADAPSSPPSAEQLEAARALYREARDLKKQGRVKEALDKALEAYRTAPTPVTALEAGGLLVDAGRLVEARDLVRGVAQLPVSPRESDKGRGARQDAATMASSIDARIPKIAVAGRTPGIDVLLDGKALPAGDAAAWQGVDPGTHAIVTRDGERTCTSINVTLAEGEERTIDLHDAAATCRPQPAPAPAPAPTPAPTATLAPPPLLPSTASDDGASSRWVGAAIAGAGVVAIGVGGAVALGAKGSYDDAAGDCPARGCTQAGFDARTSARSQADVAGVVMILGGAALAAGAVVFFWPRAADGTQAQVAVGPADVRVGVRW